MRYENENEMRGKVVCWEEEPLPSSLHLHSSAHTAESCRAKCNEQHFYKHLVNTWSMQ